MTQTVFPTGTLSTKRQNSMKFLTESHLEMLPEAYIERQTGAIGVKCARSATVGAYGATGTDRGPG